LRQSVAGASSAQCCIRAHPSCTVTERIFHALLTVVDLYPAHCSSRELLYCCSLGENIPPGWIFFILQQLLIMMKNEDHKVRERCTRLISKTPTVHK
jgi:hypothetical protein